jgi:hypothetical protein
MVFHINAGKRNMNLAASWMELLPNQVAGSPTHYSLAGSKN